ncbi:MAG TPA: GntR family transcriptional regulator [Solirubrobacteraceae bacterium]
MARARIQDPWQGVRDGLRQQILSLQRAPGDRILEVQIAEEFGVSRGPVREAIRALEGEGLVIREPRIGSMVVPIDERSAEELYSMREVMEAFAVRRALEQRPTQLLTTLSGTLGEMETAVSEGAAEALVESDVAFHTAIIVASNHDLLLQAWEGMTGLMKILMGLSARAGITDVDGHNLVIDAVRMRDADLCVQRLNEHLGIARANVMSRLSQG